MSDLGEMRASCAHQRVEYDPIEHPSGLRRDRWTCVDCKHWFAPIAAAKGQEPLTPEEMTMALGDIPAASPVTEEARDAELCHAIARPFGKVTLICWLGVGHEGDHESANGFRWPILPKESEQEPRLTTEQYRTAAQVFYKYSAGCRPSAQTIDDLAACLQYQSLPKESGDPPIPEEWRERYDRLKYLATGEFAGAECRIEIALIKRLGAAERDKDKLRQAVGREHAQRLDLESKLDAAEQELKEKKKCQKT